MSSRPDKTDILANPFASPYLDRQTYANIEAKLKMKIAELNADHTHYIPVAVVLVVSRQTCLNCNAVHFAHSSQLHVRAVNRRGDSWTRPLPLGLVPPHIPRERVTHDQQIPACADCFSEAPSQQLTLWSGAELEASFPIFDREGNSVATTPATVEALRKLARKARDHRAAAVRAASPKTKPKAAKPTLTLNDL